ncbi:MAG TPA: FHA domain-containing protein [Steroidobacteraceae bacterium]|jgi:type II secretory pathway predicted ATPase ExeA
MYLDFYKLKALPFRLAPDPSFIYWSSGHATALACMRSAQIHHNGRAVITGERGTGKTMLLEYLLQREPIGSAVRVNFPPRSMEDLQQIVLRYGESDARPAARVIVCDNAHLFEEQMLEAILTKAVVPASQAPDTRIVLMGEPALAQALSSPSLAALGDLHEHCELPALAAVDVIAYISHRLEVAGAPGPRIFRDDICVEIHRETKGNPRLVNALCDAAMMVACERELSEVGLAEVRRGLEDIGRLVAAHPTEIHPAVAAELPHEVSSDAHRRVYARLRLLYHGELVVERELRRGRFRIGRGIDNDLRIDGRYVSRYHCCVLTGDDECVLEDVHSTNGLYVNKERIRERHRLQDGDLIELGEHELQYLELRPASE